MPVKVGIALEGSQSRYGDLKPYTFVKNQPLMMPSKKSCYSQGIFLWSLYLTLLLLHRTPFCSVPQWSQPKPYEAHSPEDLKIGFSTRSPCRLLEHLPIGLGMEHCSANILDNKDHLCWKLQLCFEAMKQLKDGDLVYNLNFFSDCKISWKKANYLFQEPEKCR